MPPATIPLEDTPENIAGWKSVLLDPNEEGPSKMIRRIDDYSLAFTSTANLLHEEDRDGIFSAKRSLYLYL